MKTQNKFKVGKKFNYIGQNFKDWFYDMDFKPKKTELFSKKLERGMLDSEILKEFKPTELTLGEVYNQFTIKANKDYWMLFYCKDKNGVLRAVGVDWRGDGWVLNANSIEDPLRWHGGCQVFSRNYFNALISDPSLEEAIKVVKKAGYKVVQEL